MIESLCCTVLVLVARITAGVYQGKFTFLSKLLVPLNVILIVFAVGTFVLLILNIVYKAVRAFKGRG